MKMKNRDYHVAREGMATSEDGISDFYLVHFLIFMIALIEH